MSAQAFVRQSAIVAAQPPAAPKRVLVVGGSGGVGQLVVRVLNKCVHVFASRRLTKRA